MSSFQNLPHTSAKCEDFKSYLQKTGATDLLIKAMVSLFEEPEKPQDSVQYLLNEFQRYSSTSGSDANTDFQSEVKRLQKENEELRSKIQQLETQIAATAKE